MPHSNGESWPDTQCANRSFAFREILPDGHSEPICSPYAPQMSTGQAVSDLDSTILSVYRLHPTAGSPSRRS